MTDATLKLARRAGEDPHFLAFSLANFADQEGMGESQLMELLGTTPEGLASARLCASPRADPMGFREDVDRIARKFNLRRDALAEIAKRGQVLAALRRAAEEQSPDTAAPLLAARDRTE